MIWWEKTVEYVFVFKMLEAGRLALAPLDGIQEKASDLAILRDGKWVLVEFKRDEASIKSELKKFDTPYAVGKLPEPLRNDGHHFIVYGAKEQKLAENLKIKGCTYFHRKHVSSINDLLDSGVSFDAFNTYLEAFTALKKSSEGSAGAGGLTMQDFSYVACVSADNNNVIACMTLSDYDRDLRHELTRENTLESELQNDSDFGLSL